MKLTIERLRELFRYDPETGFIFRLVTSGGQVPGTQAAAHPKPDGYRYVRVDNHEIVAHRICWALHYGEFPKGQVDHANMDRADNRIVNLRVATMSQNNHNKGKLRTNTTGYKGVSIRKENGKYQAKISFQNKVRWLGQFDDAESASRAYQQAAKELYGEFARF